MAARVVATAGLHGSASTWVYNVVRELLIAEYGGGRILAANAEAFADLPVKVLNDQHLIVKSHHGSADLDAWLANVGATFLLSIRDPRDAAISMAQRFNAPLSQAKRWIARDCQRIMRLAPRARILLRYEDRFFENPSTIDHVAGGLGLRIEQTIIKVIFERYTTERVRDFAQLVPDLPPDRIVRSESTVFDRITQIHRTHIGDTRSGKWRELPDASQAELAALFAGFLNRFGYVDSAARELRHS